VAILRDADLRSAPQDEVVVCGLRPRKRSRPPIDLMVRSPSAARASRTPHGEEPERSEGVSNTSW
jgi:hypothetical protein